MTMKAGTAGLRVAFACGLIALGVGCRSTRPVAINLTVQVDRALAGQSVQVDLVGVSDTDSGLVKGCAVSQYFGPDNALRKSLDRASVMFGSRGTEVLKLSCKEPIWKRWLASGSTQVLVLADIPGVANDEARRYCVPLAKDRWPRAFRRARRATSVQIVVDAARVRCLTPPRPPKAK
jgi:hypothetical protein